MMQDCFMRPGPPNFFMSLQKWHSPHSVRRHASHFRQRVLLRLAPDALRLDGSLTADVDPIFGFGRLTARCWKTKTAQMVNRKPIKLQAQELIFLYGEVYRNSLGKMPSQHTLLGVADAEHTCDLLLVLLFISASGQI